MFQINKDGCLILIEPNYIHYRWGGAVCIIKQPIMQDFIFVSGWVFLRFTCLDVVDACTATVGVADLMSHTDRQ